jgi:hypothetical protein
MHTIVAQTSRVQIRKQRVSRDFDMYYQKMDDMYAQAKIMRAEMQHLNGE